MLPKGTVPFSLRENWDSPQERSGRFGVATRARGDAAALLRRAVQTRGYLAQRTAHSPSAPRFLTVFPEQAPGWSASGKFVLYIGSDGADREAIFKTDMATSQQEMMSVLDGPAFMTLSPDDEYLAYLEVKRTEHSSALGTATILDLESAAKREILEDWVAAMYWSPNGKKLALLTPAQGGDGPTARVPGLAAPPFQRGSYRWWVYDMETESLEVLATFVPTMEFMQTVPFFDQYHLSLTFWSPDSRYFVITKGNADSRDGSVLILDTTGSTAPRQVGEGTFAT